METSNSPIGGRNAIVGGVSDDGLGIGGFDFVAVAEDIARRAHAGQTDKAGVPYIEHPAWVAARVEGRDAQAVAWLHDVLEDADVTAEDLAEAGIPANVVDAVLALTRRLGEGYEAYLARVAENPLAVQVKLADLEHNSDLSRIPHPTERSRARAEKYRRAREFLSERAG